MPYTPTATAEEDTDPRLFVSVKEAAHMLGLSRNQTYELLDRRAIECRYFGKRRLVVLSSVHDFARGLPAYRDN